MQSPLATRKTDDLFAAWTTRLLILSLVGIFFLTLYPFRIVLHARGGLHGFPFLLGGWGKSGGLLDDFLNVLLFIPFGFAIGGKFRRRANSGRTTVLRALAAGALLSYGIEFLQLYIPTRDSGWTDVLTNGSGAGVGCFLFLLSGDTVLRLLSAAELGLTKIIARPRAAIIIALYFVLWCAISIPLQMQTRLSNWNPDALLMIGNDAGGQPSTAWKGDLFRLELWDRPLSPELVRELHDGDSLPSAQTGLLADYDFSGPAGFSDRRNSLPDLFWVWGPQGRVDSPKLVLDGQSWLSSKGSIAGAMTTLKKTNQFAIRMICRPAEGAESDGRIVGIWERNGELDLRIQQEGDTLVFWLRNPLSAIRYDPVWRIRRVFEANRVRDIVFSYDGSDLSSYLDGTRAGGTYREGPGVALIQPFHSVSTSEMDGYNDVYYFLIFFPGGILAGLAARRTTRRAFKSFCFFVVTILAPAALLEMGLVSVSGRPISLSYLALSVTLTLAGCVWINIGTKINTGPNEAPFN